MVPTPHDPRKEQILKLGKRWIVHFVQLQMQLARRLIYVPALDLANL